MKQSYIGLDRVDSPTYCHGIHRKRSFTPLCNPKRRKNARRKNGASKISAGNQRCKRQKQGLRNAESGTFNKPCETETHHTWLRCQEKVKAVRRTKTATRADQDVKSALELPMEGPDLLAWLDEVDSKEATDIPSPDGPSAQSANDKVETGKATADTCEDQDETFVASPTAIALESIDPDHPFLALRPTLVQMGLNAWAQSQAKGRAQENAQSRQSTQATPAQIGKRFAALSISIRPRKRVRTMGQEPAGGYTVETDSDDSDLFNIVLERESRTGALLACPFYKRFPAQYGKCMWESEQRGVKDLVRHIVDHHRKPVHCPICYTTFDRPADRDKHIVDRTCQLRQLESGMLSGVSQEQEGDLLELVLSKGHRGEHEEGHYSVSAKSDRKRPIGWFRIWDIVFPGVPQPASAFLDLPPERAVTALRLFWSTAGPQLIAEELRARSLLHWKVSQEEAALAVLYSVVLEEMVHEVGKVSGGDLNNTK